MPSSSTLNPKRLNALRSAPQEWWISSLRPRNWSGVRPARDAWLNLPPPSSRTRQLPHMPQPNASRYEIETFSPPYLFRGPRPVIASAPASVAYGTSFSIDVDNPSRIVSVALLRGASVTHQTNTEQRYVALALNQSGPRTLSLQAPPHGGIAPPGYYMLFVVDANGVPSEATWVRVG
jgi:hypothetical protein